MYLGTDELLSILEALESALGRLQRPKPPFGHSIEA
jgi:hypothetical protein